MLTPQNICASLPALSHREELKQDTFVVSREDFIPSMEALKNEHNFKGLLDLTIVEFEEEFLAVYILMNLASMQQINIEVPVPLDDPQIASLSQVYPHANHLEREAWEFFGVDYIGHPDLKRLLLPDDFVGFPLRKDYKHRSRV